MPDSRLASAAEWRSAVGPRAAELEARLGAVADWGKCSLCGVEFGSLANHLSGAKHFKAVGYAVDWSWQPERSGLVQSWEGRDGARYTWHHLTAEHTAAEGRQPPADAPPAPAAERPRKEAGEAEADGGARLASAKAWRSAVELPAQELEVALFPFVTDWSRCSVCNSDFGGLSGHLSGAKHFNSIGHKVHWAWRPKLPGLLQTWRCKDGSSLHWHHLRAEHWKTQPGEGGVDTGESEPELSTEGRPAEAESVSASSWGGASAPEAASSTPKTSAEGPPEGDPPAVEAAPPAAAGPPTGPSRSEPPASEGRSLVTDERPSDGDPPVVQVTPPVSEAARKNSAKIPAPRQGQAGKQSKDATADFTCSTCGERRPVDAFHKKYQKASLKFRECIGCVEKAEEERSMLKCDACLQRKPREAYRKRVEWDRPKCRQCLEEQDAEALFMVCVACGERKARDEYRSKVDWDRPTCKQCLEAQEVEASFAVCVACEERKPRGEYRNRVADWGAPTCRRCLEDTEHRQHQAWLLEQEERAIRQQQQRDEMTDIELREDFEQRIVERWETRRRASAPPLWEERLSWSARLRELVVARELDGTLDRRWRVETPSRTHASDKPAADIFKGFEDEGDRIVQDLGAEYFVRFVAGLKVVPCSASEFFNGLVPAGPRSWLWQGRVAASVRPLRGGWPPHRTAELRAEPRSGRVHPEVDDFAQLDHDAPDTMISLLSLGSELEVKTYSLEFWQWLEEGNYEGNVRIGSHNQTFDSLLGNANGAAAGANRTEVMNAFVDLLGLRDPDPDKACSLPHRMWRERFEEAVPPAGLDVSYGFGAEFKADKLWRQKMEANVAEALIGALKAAGQDAMVSVASALCFLSYVAAPTNAPPSNWTMAERLLALMETEEWQEQQENMRWLLDAEALARAVEEWLDTAAAASPLPSSDN